MKLAAWLFAVGYAIAFASGCTQGPPASDPTAQLAPTRLTKCVAEIVRVEPKEWKVSAGPRLIARGFYVLSFRYREPADRAAQVRVMGVYDEEGLTVDGKILAPGDVISFLAGDDVLEMRVEPDVFSNVREPHLVRSEDTEANQPAEVTSVPRTGDREARRIFPLARSVRHGKRWPRDEVPSRYARVGDSSPGGITFQRKM